jgi:hypothetical protein
MFLIQLTQPVSAPLQNSIRFLPDVLSAPPSVRLAVDFPLSFRGTIRTYSVPLK